MLIWRSQWNYHPAPWSYSNSRLDASQDRESINALRCAVRAKSGDRWALCRGGLLYVVAEAGCLEPNPRRGDFCCTVRNRKADRGIPRRILVTRSGGRSRMPENVPFESTAEDADQRAMRRIILADAAELARRRCGRTTASDHATGSSGTRAGPRGASPPRPCAQIESGHYPATSLVQVDIASGRALKTRPGGSKRFLKQLTGAEAATVVNNNAAAHVDRAGEGRLRQGSHVSRGQLVEIGGRSACRMSWRPAAPNLSKWERQTRLMPEINEAGDHARHRPPFWRVHPAITRFRLHGRDAADRAGCGSAMHMDLS